MTEAPLIARLQELITALDLRRRRPTGRHEATTLRDAAELRASAVSQLELLTSAVEDESRGSQDEVAEPRPCPPPPGESA
jgi:hypothetical protein